MKQKIIIDIRGDIAPDVALERVARAVKAATSDDWLFEFSDGIIVTPMRRKGAKSVRYLVWQGNEASK